MDKILAKGLSFKKPHVNAPSFVIGKLSIKVEEFIQFLKDNEVNGWVNIDLKKSQKGNLYGELNTWQPEQGTNQHPQYNPGRTQEEQEQANTSNIPF